MKLFTFILIISICIFTITSRVHVKKNKNLNNKKTNKVGDFGGYKALTLQLKWKEGKYYNYNSEGWSLNIPFDFKPVEGLLFKNYCKDCFKNSSLDTNYFMNNKTSKTAIIPWRKINKCEWKFNNKYPVEILQLSDDKKWTPNGLEFKGQSLKFYNYWKHI